MAREIILPQLGQTVESCVITHWNKKEGERIERGEVICEVETDKSTLEVESTEEGFILALLYGEGDMVPVLSPIAIVGEKDEHIDIKMAKLKEEGESIQDRVPEEHVEESVSRSKPEKGGKRLSVSPRARLLAEREGINLTGISGSGPGGRIIERDVLAWKSQRVSPKQVKPELNVGLKGVRKVIAERMLLSIQSSAQYTVHAYADASALLSFRTKLKEREDFKGITIGDMINFCLARTLKNFPSFNSTLEKGGIVAHDTVNLGFAVDTDKGLIVPVIKNADRLSLREMSLRARELASRCKDGRSAPEDLEGATFTVTNLGNMGIDFFTPIINPPQVAILGVCSIRPRAVYLEEPGSDIGYIPEIGLSLTADHRFIDGAPAARFLMALSKNIENIEILLAGG